MNDGFAYADILILALISGFILLRLRSVLGQKTGHDPRDIKPPAYRERKLSGPADEEPVVRASDRAARKPEEKEKDPDAEFYTRLSEDSLRKGLEAIRAADRDFSPTAFLQGARGAFDMVLDAFRGNDRDTLRLLLSPALADMFIAELDKRAGAESVAETTLLAIVSADITGAALESGKARITVRFVSDQVHLVRAKDGSIVEGNPTSSEHVEDEWVFEREVNSRNPNWKIIDT